MQPCTDTPKLLKEYSEDTNRIDTNIYEIEGGCYEDVAQISDLWSFLQGDLIDGLYEEKWYNLGILFHIKNKNNVR